MPGRSQSSSAKRDLAVARLLAVTGPVDAYDVALLEACVAELVDGGAGELVVDLTSATDVDEALLSALERASAEADRHGSVVRLAIRNSTSGVRLVRVNADMVATVAALHGLSRGLVAH